MAQTGKRDWWRQFRQYLLAAFLLVLALAALAWILHNMISRPPGLSKNLCPANGPSGHIVLLVDKTDPLNFIQKQDFLRTLTEQIEEKTPKGYLLSVFVLGEDLKENAEPLEELCNPGTGSDESELTSNIKKLRRQYEDKFLKPLLKQVDNLLTKQPAPTSPIFETMQLISINAFRKHSIKGERRLIIMSDMLHNTPQFSMFKDQMDFVPFSKTDYGRKMQLKLRDVKVELQYLMLTPHLQKRQNLKFWEDYFENAGARVVSVRSLGG